jgi:hypothetical protein
VTQRHLKTALLSAALVCFSLAPKPVQAQQARLEVFADRIAQCYIERAPEQARRWLGTLPGTREEGTVYRRSFGFEVCAEIVNIGDVWMTSMNRQRQRDLVAAAVLRTDYPSFPDALPPQTPTGTWLNRQIAALTPQAQVDRTAVQMLMFGDCLARRQWPAVTRLLRSERRSDMERAAIGELRPHLAGCLPVGLTLRIDPQVVRTVVTEPVYHILLDTPADLSRASTGTVTGRR